MKNQLIEMMYGGDCDGVEFNFGTRWDYTSNPLQMCALQSRIDSCIDNKRKYLDLSELGLTSLPQNIPAHITMLDCMRNQLHSLPYNIFDTLPDIAVLWCGHNQLTSLPSLPETLTQLWCQSNKLEVISDNLPHLTHLNCDNNQLTSLPALPKTLTHLYCDNNKLESLPYSLPKLISFSFNGNNFPERQQGETLANYLLSGRRAWYAKHANKMHELHTELVATCAVLQN